MNRCISIEKKINNYSLFCQSDVPGGGDATTPVAEQSVDSFDEAISEEAGYYDSDGVSSLRSRLPPGSSTRMQIALTGGQNEALSTADGDEATAAVRISDNFDPVWQSQQQASSGAAAIDLGINKPASSSSSQVVAAAASAGKRTTLPSPPSRDSLTSVEGIFSFWYFVQSWMKNRLLPTPLRCFFLSSVTDWTNLAALNVWYLLHKL